MTQNINDATAATATASEAVDSTGTDQTQARQIIQTLRDAGFDGSNDKLAVALGRTPEEVAAYLDGSTTIDDDLIMKVRGIATQRGIEV